MIWLKRILPFLIIALIWFGYNMYSDNQEQNKLLMEDKYSTATALVWIGTVKYRLETDSFDNYRDSVLESYGLTEDSILEFMATYEGHPEEMAAYVEEIKIKYDSILAFEDSLRQINDSLIENDTI